MGMYSYIEDNEVGVRDWEGLKRAVESVCKVYEELEKTDKEGDYGFFRELFEGTIDREIKGIDFSNWDNIKLISYWYDDYLYFFEMIAPYVSGDVSWTFEDNSEAGWIRFEDGKAIINTGEMKYTKWKPSETIRGTNEKLHNKMTRLISLNKLENQNI